MNVTELRAVKEFEQRFLEIWFRVRVRVRVPVNLISLLSSPSSGGGS